MYHIHQFHNPDRLHLVQRILSYRHRTSYQHSVLCFEQHRTKCSYLKQHNQDRIEFDKQYKFGYQQQRNFPLDTYKRHLLISLLGEDMQYSSSTIYKLCIELYKGGKYHLDSHSSLSHNYKLTH